MDYESVNSVLSQFAKFGFRKTSMDDIARAAGLSRQSVYNRFGSKEGAFKWALSAFLQHILEAATSALSDNKASPKEALLAAYQRWIGDHVEMIISTDHGMELMEQAIQSSQEATTDAEDTFYSAVASFLIKHEMISPPNIAIAADVTFALSAASKGLMMKTRTPQEFADAMRRVVDAVLR